MMTVPASILDKMDRVHLVKTSSTFSPVSALVSRNANSVQAGRECNETPSLQHNTVLAMTHHSS